MTFGDLFTLAMVLFTLAGNLALVGVVLLFLIRPSIVHKLLDILGASATLLSLALSGVAMVGSLMYSEVVGFAACPLCWIQRAFMYPIPFIFGLSFIKKFRVYETAVILATLGAVVALYHWVKDMLHIYGGSSGVQLGCPDIPGLPSCDKIYVNEFGYITIAMMSLNVFLWLILISYAGIRAQRRVAESVTEELS